jgi:hemerythrin-like domain-containing protein
MVQPVQHFRLDRIPDNLLRDPLDFLVADHMRQRKMCNVLDSLHLATETDGAKEETDAIFAYLSEDFLLHISDEEVDLFPSLLATGDLDHEQEDLIDALTRNHAIELSLASDVIVFLQRTLSHRGGATNLWHFTRLPVTFTECLRRHLAIEDQMLLPMARKCLAAADLDRIGRAMARRRNIDYPG